MSKKNIEPINKNKALLIAKIKKLLKNGREEIMTTKELSKYNRGSLVSYLNMSNIFKSGGYLLKVADDNFIYYKPQDNKKYRVRFDNVKTIYVGDVYKVTNDIVSIVKTKKTKTNFPVKIAKVPIYYAKNNYDVERFKCTEKYKNMKAWYEMFGK